MPIAGTSRERMTVEVVRERCARQLDRWRRARYGPRAMIYRRRSRVAPLGVLVAGAAVALIAGCSLNEFAVSTTAPVLLEASKAFAYESDVQFAREAAPGQLKTADGFLVSSPTNRNLLEILARGYLEYAFAFLEDDLEAMPDDAAHHDSRVAVAARATVLHDRAFGYAMRYLGTFGKGVAGAYTKDTPGFEAALAGLPKGAVPGLLYGGMALASAINLNRSDIARVAELPKAVAMIKRAYALDKTFYNGMAAVTLGLVNASQGKAMGGDPDAAKRYFEEAIQLTSGKYLMARVLQARFYAVVIQDRVLFDKILHDVLSTAPDVMPSARLPNELAHRRATRYLKQAEDLF
ncbi:MAG TPA: TRAP transporter TatT component family protein [Planctomycetota bacterium]|nr:TRAP transporter TatT component family protein [Planctomycetota bacterium]